MSMKNEKAVFCPNCPISGSFCGSIAGLSEIDFSLGKYAGIAKFSDKDGGKTSFLELTDTIKISAEYREDFRKFAVDALSERIGNCERGVANPEALSYYQCPAMEKEPLTNLLCDAVDKLKTHVYKERFPDDPVYDHPNGS